MEKGIKTSKPKKGDIVLDERYEFERPIGHSPFGFLGTEAEIRNICDKNKILISEFIKYEGYRVIGKKIRIRKSYEKAKKALEQRPSSIIKVNR